MVFRYSITAIAVTSALCIGFMNTAQAEEAGYSVEVSDSVDKGLIAFNGVSGINALIKQQILSDYSGGNLSFLTASGIDLKLLRPVMIGVDSSQSAQVIRVAYERSVADGFTAAATDSTNAFNTSIRRLWLTLEAAQTPALFLEEGTRFEVNTNLSIGPKLSGETEGFTAVQGAGELVLEGSTNSNTKGTIGAVSIFGAMAVSGSVCANHLDAFKIAGSGYVNHLALEKSTLVLGAEAISSTSGTRAVNSQLHVGHLQLSNGSRISVRQSSASVLSDHGVWLFSDKISGEGALNQIVVGKNSLLAIGTMPGLMTDGGYDYALVRNIISEANRLVSDGTLAATLLVASTEVPSMGNVRIDVGETGQSSDASGIYVHSDGQVILDLESDSQQSKVVTERIRMDSEATLIVNGWDGKSVLNLSGIDGLETLLDENIHLIGHHPYTLVRHGSTLMVNPSFFSRLPGLKAHAIVAEVEQQNSELVRGLPGYSFIVDAMELNGRASFATNVDAVLSLPVSSGLLTASESAFRLLVDLVESRPRDKSSTDVHWFAQGLSSGLRRENHLVTVSGYVPLKSKVSSVVLGVDKSFSDQWSGTVYFAGVSTDNKSGNRTYVQSTSESTAAALGVTVEKKLGPGVLRLDGLVSRFEGEAKMVNTGHWLKSEPNQSLAMLGVRYAHRWGDFCWVRPSLGAKLMYSRVGGAQITDNKDSGGSYGTGFDVSVDKRIWSEFELGLASGISYIRGDYLFKPEIRIKSAVSTGDREIKSTTRLKNAKAAMTSGYQSTPKLRTRAELSVLLAKSGKKAVYDGGFFGFGAEKISETSYDWEVSASAGYERSSYGTKSKSVMLSARFSW